MSNSNRDPKNFPPDDVSDDWGKTNYNFSPKQSPPADEWGKTAVNINVPRHQSPDDFDKTLPPGQSRKDADWGATQANIHIPRESYDRGGGGGGGDFGGRNEPEHKSTMPYFQLPENERAKYQNLPATPPAGAAAAGAQAQKSEKKGGIPPWVWAAGGLSVMFLFALAVIALVYFVFLPKRDFELTIKGAPAGSEIFVDGTRWGLSSADGSAKLPALRANEGKTIEIRHPKYTCKPQPINGERGSSKEMVAQCTEIATTQPPANDCQNIKKGDFAKAAKCANDALDGLKEPFTVQDLLNAMNMYIINFPSGKFDIVKPEDKAFLQKAAGYMQKLPPNVMIEVGGHTDNVGNKASNQTLSDNRAKSVKTALVGFGVKEAILQTRGYGDSKPKASNDTDDGKFQNRRIEYQAILR